MKMKERDAAIKIAEQEKLSSVFQERKLENREIERVRCGH